MTKTNRSNKKPSKKRLVKSDFFKRSRSQKVKHQRRMAKTLRKATKAKIKDPGREQGRKQGGGVKWRSAVQRLGVEMNRLCKGMKIQAD